MADDDEGALLGFAGSMGELLSCLVRVRGCLGGALGNTDPRQFFGAPDMQVGCEPARVHQRPSLNEHDGAVCRAVALDVGAAVATEEPVERFAARAAMILVKARTAAFDAERVMRHGDVHRESGARVLAAGLAMADHLHQRLSVRAVAYGTAKAPSLDRRHPICLPSCSWRWPPDLILPCSSCLRLTGGVQRPRSS